ncbi:hypothetical protein [Rhodoferax sp.]|uniref:hypothetical protein n=1 Tax=Rhodoferax sp. TaxID=50421 RepID=UPI00283C61AD|nr:hypothetical protein [Rhodoferax sp.]MDR3371998.1 hypothetical protein [Rhodoferax sp.]
MTYPDGSLLASHTQPPVWLVQDGQRHWIPSPDIFNADGFSWDAILFISDAEIAAIPQGPDVPLYTSWITPGDNDPVVPGQTEMSIAQYGNHAYRLWVDGGFSVYGRAKFVTQTGVISGETIARCSVVFFGFTSSTAALVTNSDGMVIYATPEVRAGASAKGFGPPQVNIRPWTFTVPMDVANQAAGFTLILGSHSTSLSEFLANSVGGLITTLTPAISAVGALFSGASKSGGGGTKTGGNTPAQLAMGDKPIAHMTTSPVALSRGWGGTPQPKDHSPTP